MSEKKEGLGSKIWHRLVGEKYLDNEEALPKFGIDLFKTDTFDKRLKEVDELNMYIQNIIENKDEKGKDIDISDPKNRLAYLKKSANGINTRVQKIAIPWGTAGEVGWYAELSLAWSTLYTWALITIDSISRLMDKKDKRTDTSTLISKLDFYFYVVIIQPALLMVAYSYKERDVVPPKMTLIQAVPQFGGGGPNPYRSNIGFGQPIKQEGQG